MKLSQAITKINKLEEKIRYKDLYIVELKEDNEKLIEKQQAFQDELIQKIKDIKNLGPFRRFLAYGRLLWDLISTIEKAISEQNEK